MTAKIININVGYANNSRDKTSSHRAYAARNNYEYVQATQIGVEENPVWARHSITRALIADVDHLMTIDTDAEVLDQCPPFHKLIEQNTDYDLFLALGHSFRPNAGVMLFRGGKTSIVGRFIDTVLAERHISLPEKDQAVVGGDNGHIINFLRRSEFKSRLFLLSPAWNNTFQPTDWDYIRHYTGPMSLYLP